jgi:glycosyltransferase involved in cell wall biosynthesis
VIPCFNEASRLAESDFLAFLAVQSDFNIHFVNDGSRDSTAAVLDALGARHPDRISVQHLSRNVGKAAAVREGVLRVLDLRPELVGFWDADLATPFAEAPRFAALLDADPSKEWVFGSRVRLLGRHIERRPIRHYLGRVFATAVSVTLDLGIYDSQCGAKLFRGNDLTRAVFAEPFISRWIFDVELLARAERLHRQGNLRPVRDVVVECPLQEWVDKTGSKVRPRDFLKAGLELAAIRRRYLGRR